MLTSLLRTLAIGAAVLAGGAARAQAEKPVRIGAFISVTGQGAFLGEASKKALELYIADLNRAGGVARRPVELVLYDSKSSARDAAALARRLIDQDRVDLIIGGNTTGETMAVVPLIEESKTPFIALAGASIVVDPVKRWVFKTPHTDQMSIEKVYGRVKGDGGSKIALLSGAGGYDQSCRKNAKEMAARFGVQLVSDEQHGAGDADVTTQLTNIRSASPDAVLYCGFGAPSSIVAKNHKQLGLAQRLYMTVGVASRAYIDGADGAAEGSRVTGSALLAFEDLSTSDPIHGVTKRFVEAYRAAYKEEPSTFAGYAYDAALLAAEAIRKAGTTDKEKVRDSLESLKEIPGLNGLYTFSASNHLGFSAQSLRIVEVKGGKYRLVD